VTQAAEVHPLKSPRQTRWAKRINNRTVYNTIKRAFYDCKAQAPILMAPCGYGWFFDRFQRDGLEIVGIDIDPKTVAWARTAVDPSPKVYEGSALEMPFKDGQFDFTVSNRFILHFDKDFRAKAFKEYARVTRRFLLVHYDYPTSFRQLLHKIRGYNPGQRNIKEVAKWQQTQSAGHKQIYDRAAMEAEGAAGGWRVKKLYFVCRFVSDRVYCLYEKAN
jgi:hypothetical protein